MNFQKIKPQTGLHFVGVPIGNARDITLRALDTLANADCLAAEDTRSLRKLMDIHGVPLSGRRVHALHDHSGPKMVEQLVALIEAGQSVVYASEAGMPLIADPGFELSRAVAAAGLPMTCVPGPSAVVTALAIAGLPTDAFLFGGFLPNASAARKAALQKWVEAQASLVFYESPKRVVAMLQDAANVLGGDRKAALCRELTKKFEEVRRGTLTELAEGCRAAPPKGEIVVIIDRADSSKLNASDFSMDLEAALDTHSMRDAVDLVANAHGLPRRKVYQMALTLKPNKDE